MKLPINDIKPNPDNPRIIKDEKFKQLVKSIQDFPQMLELRPVVINADNMVLGGNMRLKACKEAGMTEVPVVRADSLTEAQQREFIIKDNVGFGEWDWGILIDEWPEAADWGLDIPDWLQEKEIEEKSGYETSQMWFLNIEFKNENECQKWYEKLIKEGLLCKIVQ